MQKIKNMLHHNKDETTTTSNTHHTTDPLDKNKDGRVDAQDFQGKGVNYAHHNPLDRNHDGKVDLKDLKPSASREAPLNDQRLASMDKNHDGKVDSRDFVGQQGMGMGHNPMDRNFDGKVDALDFQGTSNMTGLAMPSTTSVRSEPINLERVEKGVVVHEHLHPLEKEEIQPVIHREREQLEVRQITEQLHETQIQPTLIQQRELAPEVREVMVERSAPIQENIILPTVERDATMRSVQMNAPIVNETVKKTIIEEIQPVLERDVIQTTLIQERKDIYEKIVEAPIVSRETTIIQDRGIVGGSFESLRAQGFNVAPMGTSTGMAHHNPLDKNFDGKVDSRDFTGQQGMGHNPMDRNFDGKVDSRDFNGQQGMAHHNPMDRNFDGKVDARDLQGKAHHNPMDRNFDGKVDMKDLAPNKAAPLNSQAPLRTL